MPLSAGRRPGSRFGGERRRDLHPARPGPDDRDPFSARVIGVIPCIGPQDGALEVVDPSISTEFLALTYPPIELITNCAVTAGWFLISRRHAPMVSSHFCCVTSALARKYSYGPACGRCPAGSGGSRVPRRRIGSSRGWGEGQLVPQRRNVDGQAGVVIVAPGAAELVVTFQDDEVGDALLAQQVCDGDSAGASPDDGHVVGRPSHGRLRPDRRRCGRPRTAARRVGCPSSPRSAVTARNSTTSAQSIHSPAPDPRRLRLIRCAGPPGPMASTDRLTGSAGHRRYFAATAPGCFH